MTRASVLLACTATACASPAAVGEVRFANRPPVWRVNDRMDLPAVPEERRDLVLYDGFFHAVYRRLTEPLTFATRRRAMGTNSLDEVPDSTWFTNRIGARDMTPGEIARGPEPEPPDVGGELLVVGGKSHGASIGFRVRDRGGRRYLLKFDHAFGPELETAGDVICQRLFWALGYNVPNDYIVHVRREQLAIAPDVDLTPVDIDEMFARERKQADGTYRVLLSELLPGKVVGGFPALGVRAEDPNDTIPHEHRRELRGLGLYVSWLQHTDMREGQTLDVYVSDPDVPGRHYLVHYLNDFGKTLGAWVLLGVGPTDGHTSWIDTHYLLSIVTFGLWKRPWEGTPDPHIPGVSRFDAEHYRPDHWSPNRPYPAFLLADEYDMLWATRLLLRLTPAHVRAAVEQGQFSDPRAVDYLTRVLIGRQRKAARYWLSRVNPLVDFALEPGSRLCFDDLLLAHHLAPADGTVHRAASYDGDGRALGPAVQLRPASRPRSGRVCASVVPAPATRRDGYTIVRLDTRRAARAFPPVEVHLARRGGALHIIGIDRR